MGKKKLQSSSTAPLNSSSIPSSQLTTIIQDLETRIKDSTPSRGSLPPQAPNPPPFQSLPISPFTLSALKKSNFKNQTKIQSATLPHSLAGRDILGAAKTGSGKTLSFVIPILENLFRSMWSKSSGLGSIVISPTRELATQIFEVFRMAGRYHGITAGVVTGGKKEFREEQGNVIRCNVLVATPGRLLQHLEQTPGFDCTSLKVLVLDEADRCLDLGFRTQITRIMEYMPEGRQTLLFSATQTKNVGDLARLSLNKPEYISVDEKSSTSTPTLLQQNYIVCTLPQKLDVLYSFVKSHLKNKTIVFLSSCNQVKFVLEVMRGLQPGVSVMGIHGKIKQRKRTHIYFDFLAKEYAVLFATDVAARGLDFPAVDWVLQMDCPEDSDMYIHRAGRTARNNKPGKSLLMLTPTEKDGAIKMLEEKKISLKKLSINPSKTMTVSKRAASVVASDANINTMAKKAFKAYVKSVHLMPNKDVFKGSEIDLEGFAKSLGLATCPNLRFLKEVSSGEGGREDNRKKKNKSRKLERLKMQIKEEKLKKRIEKLGGKGKIEEENEEEESDDDGGGLFTVKRKHDWGDSNTEVDADLEVIRARDKAVSKKQKIRADGTTGYNKKTVFDDDGAEVDDSVKLVDAGGINVEKEERDYVERVKERLGKRKEEDKRRERERVREKRLKVKGLGEEEEEQESGSGSESDSSGGSSGEESGSDSDKGGNSDSNSESDSDSDEEIEGDDKTDMKKAEEMLLKGL